jgi:hypothetical protein
MFVVVISLAFPLSEVDYTQWPEVSTAPVSSVAVFPSMQYDSLYV